MIIPAFIVEGSVGKVVEEVHTLLPQVEVLVVNDGSTDLTSEIARSSRAIVLDLPFNRGIGGPCKRDTEIRQIRLNLL